MIEVGEYVRTSSGMIGKLIRIERDDIDTSLKWYVFNDGKNERYINKPYIVKNSESLIYLIEEGDYVNGCLVIRIFSNSITIMSKYGLQDYDFKDINNGKYEIYSILTKEQYEANCYKIK